jgi:hypothetical protein
MNKVSLKTYERIGMKIKRIDKQRVKIILILKEIANSIWLWEGK